MSELALSTNRLPAMVPDAIAKVRELEAAVLELPQVRIATSHVIHGGMYSRTICVPAGCVLTGALIKIATLLIVCGTATVFIGDQALVLEGYNVVPASAGRKQAFLAHSDTYLTMLFPSDAQTIEAAEAQFTDEAALLFSRVGENVITVTGE